MTQTIRIPASGVTLTADEWPADGPVVVLAHGGGQTRHSWGQTAEALAAEGFHVLAIDQRGHGDSDWAPSGDYHNEQYGDDAIAVAKWCGQAVIWVGASLGGLAGILATASAPSLFSKLILVDITARPATGGVDRVLAFMAETSKVGFATLEDAAQAVAAYQPHRSRAPSTRGLAKNLRKGEDGRWHWHWDPAFLDPRRSAATSSTRAAQDGFSSIETAAKKLTLPTLLIRGRLSDLVTDAEVDEFLSLVPHAEYVNVNDAAHMVAGDVNDVFTTAVVEFVEADPEPS